MGRYLIYLLICVLFLLLFILSGGMFRASAAFLQRKCPKLSEYVSQETMARVLMLLFAANLLGAAATWKESVEDTVSRGYLERNDYGEEAVLADLGLKMDGKVTEVELEIAPRQMTAGEIQELMDRAERELPGLVFGDSLNADMPQGGRPEEITACIRHDIVLPDTVKGTGVSVEWMSDQPELLDWDGHIGEAVPESGVQVTLSALLSYGVESREVPYRVLVCPRELGEAEAVQKAAQEAVDSENDGTVIRVNLPGSIGGKTVQWMSMGKGLGRSMLLLGIFAAVAYILAERNRAGKKQEADRERMLRNYPGIVSKLVLLVSAGMSLRRAMERIAGDYRKRAAAGKGAEPGYEEIVHICREMANGISEADAYRNLGLRTEIQEYRTFSVVLAQNLRKGGSEMTVILGRMAEEAFEERKKRARILGEEAGTKLLGPMLVMLVLVMGILMVPAIMSFF